MALRASKLDPRFWYRGILRYPRSFQVRLYEPGNAMKILIECSGKGDVKKKYIQNIYRARLCTYTSMTGPWIGNHGEYMADICNRATDNEVLFRKNNERDDTHNKRGIHLPSNRTQKEKKRICLIYNELLRCHLAAVSWRFREKFKLAYKIVANHPELKIYPPRQSSTFAKLRRDFST